MANLGTRLGIVDLEPMILSPSVIQPRHQTQLLVGDTHFSGITYARLGLWDFLSFGKTQGHFEHKK